MALVARTLAVGERGTFLRKKARLNSIFGVS